MKDNIVKILVSIVTAGVITGINQLYYQFQFSAFESMPETYRLGFFEATFYGTPGLLVPYNIFIFFFCFFWVYFVFSDFKSKRSKSNI